MKNKTIGTILLCVAALCTTVDLAVSKMTNAFHIGMVFLGGKGGSLPKEAVISTEVFNMVIILVITGMTFLFLYEKNT
jgi:hypothetical protein